MCHCHRRVSNSDFTKGATQVSVFSEPSFYSPAYYSPKPLLVRLSASSTETPSRSAASTPIPLQFSSLLPMSRWDSQSQIQRCPPRGFSRTHKVPMHFSAPTPKFCCLKKFSIGIAGTHNSSWCSASGSGSLSRLIFELFMRQDAARCAADILVFHCDALASTAV